ncbi:extracellular solute-binding protein (plasmid) [Sinorhizobium meliloti]|nr:extracellular solute-binding protein [Sinorhizobium meliloti]
MFAKAGVEEPKEGWTWDDLRAKAAKFRDEAGKVYGFAVDAKPDPYDFEQFLWSNGTKYISDDGKEIDGYMNSDVAAAVLGMFADMARKEEAVTLHLGDETGGDTLFQGGKIAMFQSAMWDKADIDAAGFSYGVAPLPTFGDRPAHSALGVSAISIAKDAAHPDLAWEFVKFFSSPDSVAMRVNDLPVRNSVAEAKGMTKDPVYKPFFDILATSNTERHAYLKNANWGQDSGQSGARHRGDDDRPGQCQGPSRRCSQALQAPAEVRSAGGWTWLPIRDRRRRSFGADERMPGGILRPSCSSPHGY